MCQLQLTVRDCPHEETQNNLHIVAAEFEAMVQNHNTEKKKLHENILVLRRECRKQARLLEEQVSSVLLFTQNRSVTQRPVVKPAVRACYLLLT